MTKGQKTAICVTTVIANMFAGLLCAVILLMLSVINKNETDKLLTFLAIIPFILGIFANIFIYKLFRKRLEISTSYRKLVLANICGLCVLPLLAMLEVLKVIDFLQNF